MATADQGEGRNTIKPRHVITAVVAAGGVLATAALLSDGPSAAQKRAEARAAKRTHITQEFDQAGKNVATAALNFLAHDKRAVAQYTVPDKQYKRLDSKPSGIDYLGTKTPPDVTWLYDGTGRSLTLLAYEDHKPFSKNAFASVIFTVAKDSPVAQTHPLTVKRIEETLDLPTTEVVKVATEAPRSDLGDHMFAVRHYDDEFFVGHYGVTDADGFDVDLPMRKHTDHPTSLKHLGQFASDMSAASIAAIDAIFPSAA